MINSATLSKWFEICVELCNYDIYNSNQHMEVSALKA